MIHIWKVAETLGLGYPVLATCKLLHSSPTTRVSFLHLTGRQNNGKRIGTQFFFIDSSLLSSPEKLPGEKYFVGHVRAMSSIVPGSRLHEAAKLTVNTYIRNGMVVGLRFGRASDLVIQYLWRQLREGKLKNIIGIPTSISSASEAAKAGIPLVLKGKSVTDTFKFKPEGTAEEIDDLFLGDAEVWRTPSLGYAGPM